MTQYLARKCPRCGNVVKIIREDGKVIRVEGGRLLIICRRLNHSSYIVSSGHESQKMVWCTALTRRHMDGDSACYHGMRISKFEEMKV